MYYKVTQEALDPASKVSFQLSKAVGLVSQAIEKIKIEDNASALDIVYEAVFPCIRVMKQDVMVVDSIHQEVRKHYYKLLDDTYRILLSISFSSPSEAIIDILQNVSTIYVTLRDGWDKVLLNKDVGDTKSEEGSKPESIKKSIEA